MKDPEIDKALAERIAEQETTPPTNTDSQRKSLLYRDIHGDSQENAKDKKANEMTTPKRPHRNRPMGE
jgi:hypothetical protein